MTKHRITLIPGDGTGPELADAAKRCVDALGLDIGWDVVYDEGRRISPQNPVILDTNEKLAAYQVILT